LLLLLMAAFTQHAHSGSLVAQINRHHLTDSNLLYPRMVEAGPFYDFCSISKNQLCMWSSTAPPQ
jgi:hypothetical protein